MIKFEIFTEDLNRELIVKMITKVFKGFTITENIGFWDGIQEKSITITIFADKADNHLIVKLCGDIKQLNKQDAVLASVTYTDARML